MNEINGRAYQPDDAATLRQATAMVIKRVVGEEPTTGMTADDAAKAVLLVARTGYAHDPRRSINADDLAEAAIARMRATGR